MPDTPRLPTGHRCARPRCGSSGYRAAGLWAWLVVSAVFATCPPARAVEPAPAVPERDLNLPVISGSQEAFYPYSFRDRDGVLKGFAVDLMAAVAREMKLNIRAQGVVNVELNDALLSGRVDLIPLWSETRLRRNTMDFSVPILRFETVVVIRKDGSVKTPADLRGKHVAVGQKGTVGELYITEQHPDVIREYAPTTEEQLRALSQGKYDALIMSRLTAVTLIKRFHLKNLTIIDGIRGYDVRYCTAVRKGDAQLLARVNEGIAVLHRTGEFEEIYERWFGRFDRAPFTYGEIVSAVAIALALICSVALWAYLRQRTLSKRITRQATELAEQRSLLAALYDKHPLATLVVEIPAVGDPLLISLNQEATLLFSLEKKGDAIRPISELNLTKEMQSFLAEAIARQKTSDKPERWEVQLPRSKRLLEATTVPLDSHGEGRRICILTADVTKRRLMDQEIAKSRRLRALGELVGGIAHEFNNLLTPILATSSMLRAAPQPVTVSNEELNIIDQAAQRAADLTKRLLAFGRKVDDPARSVRLTEAIANCEALLKTMVDRRIRWENDLPPDLPPVAFNPTDFNQIVFNLVLNARDTLLEKLGKISDPGWQPRLRISVTALPAGRQRSPRATASLDGITGWQRFTVEDNGMGIPPEIVDRIFEPFYTTKEVGKGTGLGLSMVWHQVTDAGGDIEVESKPGEGSAFHIYLPRRETRAPLPASQKADSATPVPPTSQARVLVVEDEPLIARTATRMLQRRGCNVSAQDDGLKAWQELSNNYDAYDLLLVDLSMPQMDGIDLIKRLRALPFKGRIVVMSGRVSDENLRVLQELKVDRLLPKPFNTEQFNATVGTLLTPRSQ
ncbi:MAG: transporter substrate-binding domain-containing protein [Nibricoccus sp.]